MKSKRSRFLLVLLVGGAFGACSSDYGSGPGDVTACVGDVTVTVGSGTTPQFSWSPACKLSFVIVEPGDSGLDLWSVITEGGNQIAPPVRYGIVPAGAEELDPPVPLVAGTTYKVAVGRYTGPGGDDGVIIGMRTFTP